MGLAEDSPAIVVVLRGTFRVAIGVVLQLLDPSAGGVVGIGGDVVGAVGDQAQAVFVVVGVFIAGLIGGEIACLIVFEVLVGAVDHHVGVFVGRIVRIAVIGIVASVSGDAVAEIVVLEPLVVTVMIIRTGQPVKGVVAGRYSNTDPAVPAPCGPVVLMNKCRRTALR